MLEMHVIYVQSLVKIQILFELESLLRNMRKKRAKTDMT